MSIPVQIHLPKDATSALIVQYITANPVIKEQADTIQRLVQTLKHVMQPGETLQVDLIHGHSSVSLHEGEPIVRLLPSPTDSNTPTQTK